MLRDYVNQQHFGEKTMRCHADNCCGQNKNNAFLHCLCWRCMTGLNTTITYSLWSMVGHTQFRPDWLAGLFKSHYRKADAIQCLDDVVDIVHQSTPRSGILQPKVVGEEDTPVPTYSWTDHLQQLLKPLPGLRQYHLFRWVVSSTATVWYTVVPNHHTNYLNTVLTVVFWLLQIESAEPGVVFAKMRSVAEEECFCLLRESVATMPTPADLPGKKAALDLSQERQAYLYKEIRPFVDEAKADLVAPKLPNAHHESKRRRQTGDTTG